MAHCQATIPRRPCGQPPAPASRWRKRAPGARKARSPPAQLKEVEDREIEKIIGKQEEIGLKLATDGEFRRSWWHFDFLRGARRRRGLRGSSTASSSRASRPSRAASASPARSASPSHPMVEHFKFLKAHTKVTPKMTIPAPSVMHFRRRPQGLSQDRPIRTSTPFFDDLGKTYQKAVTAFYDAGCRYLQFDDTAWAYLCSQERTDEGEGARRRSIICRKSTPAVHQQGARGQARPT